MVIEGYIGAEVYRVYRGYVEIMGKHFILTLPSVIASCVQIKTSGGRQFIGLNSMLSSLRLSNRSAQVKTPLQHLGLGHCCKFACSPGPSKKTEARRT